MEQWMQIALWSLVAIVVAGSLFFLYYMRRETAKMRLRISEGLSANEIDSDYLKSLLVSDAMRNSFRQFVTSEVVRECSEAIRTGNKARASRIYDVYAHWYGEENRQNIHNIVTEQLLQPMLRPLLDDFKLDDIEVQKIKAEAFELGNTEYSDEAFLKKKFESYIMNHKIESGDIEPVKADYIMGNNEECYFKEDNVEVLENKMVTSRVNYGGPVARIRLAKGFGFNLGSLAVSTNKVEKTVSHGVGDLNVTNKRILFRGRHKAHEIKLSKIVDLERYTDGVMIFKSTGNPVIIKTKKPELFCSYLGILMQA